MKCIIHLCALAIVATSCQGVVGFQIAPATSVTAPRKASTHNSRAVVSSTRIESKKGDPDVIDDQETSLLWLPTLVAPLLLVYVSNQWTRSSIYYLVSFSEGDAFRAMNVDIGFSEAQYGLLASLAFTALFAVASLGAGIASDRYDRKTLTVTSAVGWGVAALGTSLSSTYPEVLGWRVLMGLACAFTTPAAYTLINQKVPSDRAAFATSLYGTGVALGGALASLSILLDNEYGWRDAMQIISIAAFGSALLATLLLDSDSKEEKVDSDTNQDLAVEQESNDLASDIQTVISVDRIKWIYLGSFFRFCSGLCIGVWSAPYFKMAFPENASDYAVAQALITAIAGSSSGLLGGAASDWLVSKVPDDATDRVGVRMWVPVVGSLLATPAWYMAIHSTESFQMAMIWLSIEYLVAECWFGPTISSLLATTDARVGGTAQGLFTMTGAAANLAPTLLGLVYGKATNVEASPELVTLLSYAVCFGYLSSAACFAVSTQATPPSEKKKAL